MLPAHSSKRCRGALAALVLLLGGCAHRASSSDVAGASPAPLSPLGHSGVVGWVNMDRLLKAHPLYGQLAQLDQDVAALQMQAVGPSVAANGADLRRQTAQLQAELNDALERTRRELRAKQDDYSKRENEAIRAALAALPAGAAGPPVGAQMQENYQAQAQTVNRDAAANLQKYQQQVLAQGQSAVASLERSLGERAMREYRAKSEQLQAKESALALQLATDDAAERLSLRTKLSNLALDEAQRKDVTAQLDAIDRRESDQIAAMRNRDQATLADYQVQLRERSRQELETEVAQIRRRSYANIDARTKDTRTALVGQVRPLPASVTQTAVAPVMVPKEMRDRLMALHKKYQDDFNHDANATMQAFQKTKADLTKRFDELTGIDEAAQQSARKQLAALQKQRGELYGEIFDQIQREVRLTARRRDITVVFSDVVAPAGGVDLTADAEKDIESLHE